MANDHNNVDNYLRWKVAPIAKLSKLGFGKDESESVKSKRNTHTIITSPNLTTSCLGFMTFFS